MPRYDVRRRERANEWTVIDTATGEIARDNDVLLAGLPHVQALEIAERLNKLEKETSEAPR